MAYKGSEEYYDRVSRIVLPAAANTIQMNYREQLETLEKLCKGLLLHY